MVKLQLLFCCLALSQTKAVTFNCRDADNLLIETGDLTVDFFTFTNRMELNKTFSTQDEPLVIKTEYEFLGMDGDNVRVAKNICENDFGYDFCGVVNNYKQTDVINDLPVVREVTEVFKPVCFPKSCGLDQINIVDPRPTGCNPNGIFGNCEIISQEAMCITRTEEPTDTSTCEADVIPPTSPFYMRVGFMLSFILRDCNTVIQGGQGTYCSIESGDLKAQTTLDFKGRETLDQYTVYVDTCVEAGGQICDADLTSSYVINNDGIGDIFMTDKFESFPFCISPVCKADNGDKEEIAVETFRRYASESLVTPACLEETCEVTVSSLACVAPSMVSATSAPTIALTLFPTPDPTQALSTKPSENSSSHPTSTPSSSFVPTETSTLLPTLNPRAKKTFMPSSTPTVEPTLNPRPKKTLLPSNISSVKPTSNPTVVSSETPTESSSMQPSSNPRPKKTQMPSSTPTVEPTLNPRPKKTQLPSNISSVKPTSNPTVVSSETKTESSSMADIEPDSNASEETIELVEETTSDEPEETSAESDTPDETDVESESDLSGETVESVEETTSDELEEPIAETDASDETDAESESVTPEEIVDTEMDTTSDTTTLMTANFMPILLFFAGSLSTLLL